jgi:putative peptidoglycan lipid II flippase
MENNSQKTEKKQHSIVAKGLSLSFLTLLSRIMGLLREMTKAKFLGTSAYSDAFGIAFMIPNLFRRLFAENSISVAFIPTFKKYLQENDSEDGKKITQNFVSATFTLISFLTVVFVTVGIIFTPLILRIFYGKENGETLNEATILTRIMFPYLVVISIAAFCQGILNGLKIFAPSGFTPILFNGLVVLATYLLAPHMANPARAMAVGVIIGGIVQCIFQIPFVLHNDWKLTFTSLKTAFTNPGTITVIKLVVPTILGMACYQLNDLVSSTLATHAGEGVVSSLQYSLRLQELILGIFAVSIGTVILPDLSGFAQKANWSAFNDMLTQSIKIMALISIPITFYSYIMGENLITLVFASGKFDRNSITMTLNVFRWHIVGLFFIAVNRIISPAFYAQGNTKLPTLAGIISFVVNMLVALVLVNFGFYAQDSMHKGEGIALALTIASAVNTIVLFIFLKRTPTIDVGSVVKSTLRYTVRMILFSVIAALPLYFFRDKLVSLFAGHNRFYSQGMPVLLSALYFFVIGVLLLLITRDPIVSKILAKFKRRTSGK